MQITKILLVGSGQVGSRHLQAISTLDSISEVQIVDYNNKSIELSKSRLNEVEGINKKIKFNWYNDLKVTLGGGDLCIVATSAKERCALIKEIATNLGYRRFLIEKIVAQSVDDYVDLLDFCERKNISIWVNFQMRTFSIYKYIKSKITPSIPITFINLGGNSSLACNGMHYVDLFVFYDGSRQIKTSAIRIDPILYPSRRGNDFFDLSGTLTGYSERGGQFILSYPKNSLGCDCANIANSNSRFIVDYINKFIYESYADSGWKWKLLRFSDNYLISHTTRNFVLSILENNSCELPTLSESFLAHQFILNTLLPHFNRLMETNNGYCPVT